MESWRERGSPSIELRGCKAEAALPVPARFLPTPGRPVADYGQCLLRFDAVG